MSSDVLEFVSREGKSLWILEAEELEAGVRDELHIVLGDDVRYNFSKSVLEVNPRGRIPLDKVYSTLERLGYKPLENPAPFSRQ